MAMAQQQQTRLDALLTRFGQSLRSSEEFYAEGRLLGDRVFEKLKNESNFSVARVYFGGSFGKKTDVIECDLDLHVLLNDIDISRDRRTIHSSNQAGPLLGWSLDISRDLENILDDFETLLTLHEDELKIHGDIERKKRSLSFKFQNGIEVDLLPANNITDDLEVMRKMEEDPENYSFFFNPSFVDKQISFLKSQDSFTHTLIRLAKFWWKSLYLGQEEFKGGCAMIEVICAAVAADESEGQLRNFCMFQAFTKVIEKLSKVDTLKIAFVWNETIGEKLWRRLLDSELCDRNGFSIIPKSVGTWEILERKGFIIDPSNPFQDLLEGKSSTVIEKLKRFALTTRQRLDHLVGRNAYDQEFMLRLFEPQPLNITKESLLQLPYDFYISCVYPCPSSFCDMKVRNRNGNEKRKVQNAIKLLKMNLLGVINAAVNGDGGRANTTNVYKAVRSFIGRSLQQKLVNVPRDRHDEMDITLTIPYQSEGEKYAVRFSASWKL
ncbi:unnamed protein product [Orchesella dallaii]|uniref:2'-5'-oligoadenylate synthetase 1 domain-containing protein n=1 Tax=Orchesella dallaii TaxID=48710 RepID=A0ABP1S175_9HEXA